LERISQPTQATLRGSSQRDSTHARSSSRVFFLETESRRSGALVEV